MASFMEKLKKGMNTKTIASAEEEKNEEEIKDSEQEGESLPEEVPQEEDEQEEEKEAEEDEESEGSASPVGPEEISIEELEERVNENKPGGMADNASTKNLVSRMIIEEEPVSKKTKKHKKTENHIKKAHHASQKQEESHKIKTTESKRREWFQSDGELVVDVYELDGYVIIKSAIAGVRPEDLDISIENDTVSIKGNRKEVSTESHRNYFHQECYWGSFSREIILPTEVDGGKTEASMKNGILTIKVPKIEHQKKKISIR